MNPRNDRQATWHITDLPDGWELEVHFRVRLAALLPRYMRLNRVPFVVGMTMYTGVVLAVAWMFTGVSLGLTLYVATLAPMIAFLLTAITWPLRYSRGPAPPEHAYLRYWEGNRRETIRASRAAIDVPAGVFALHHLANLEISQVDPELDLYGLTFWGDFEHGQVFRWPGVPKPVAVEIRSAILERIDPHALGSGR